MRQIRTFQKRGWEISVVGYPGSLPIPDSWDFHDMTMPLGRAPEVPAASLEPVAPESVALELAAASGQGSEQIAANPAEPPPVAEASRSFLARLPAFLYWRAVYPCTRRLHAAWARATETFPQRRGNDKAKVSMRSLIETLYETDRSRPISIDEAREIFFATERNAHFRDAVASSIPRADLVVAHDYMTLPFAADLSARMRAPFVIDIHEYAREQYHFEQGSNDERYFDRVTRPMIEALHAEYFPNARALSTVCNGISRQLQIDHALPKAPTVVRSTPFYSKQPFRPTGETIVVMYHGLVDSSRHLEVGIRSLPLWRPEFRFTIRGPGRQDYINQLMSLARELGVEDRVSIEPPVPFDEIIQSANRADIGYLAFMNYSRQRQYASPNKFFEYIMAGLALVVMDVPELAPIVREAEVGRLIDDFTPETIAAAINGFERASIDAAKRASLELASELCWEREQERMIAAYGLAEFEAAS